MDRKEYDTLVAQKAEIQQKLDRLDGPATLIAEVMRPDNRSAEFQEIEGETAWIRISVGCGCHPSRESFQCPAAWIFDENLPETLKKYQADKEKAESERKAMEDAASKAALEEHDKMEYDRLQQKFAPATPPASDAVTSGPSTASSGSPT